MIIVCNPAHMLFVEPSEAPSARPVIDAITCKLTAAWRLRQTDPRSRTRGFHACTGRGCLVYSDNAEHYVAGVHTHSLCLHYVAYHRAEIPAYDLERIARFELGDAHPSAEELGSQASMTGNAEAEQRWRDAFPHRERRDALLRSAARDFALDIDGRRAVLISAEDAAVAAGYSPRPDYFDNMGVTR